MQSFRVKVQNTSNLGRRLNKELGRNYQLYLLVLLPVIYIVLFAYVPMYGILLAFKKYRAVDGIWGSAWVGFANFQKFFGFYQFQRIMVNTLLIGVYSLLAGFPFPILLALALNSTVFPRFKKWVQMATYAPYFISTVVMVGLLMQFLSPKTGIVNQLLGLLGMQPQMFMTKPEFFRSVYVWSGIWQGAGWGSIVYLAALAGIDPSLHEAAIIDGATRLQRVRHVDIPGILPTMTIMLILSAGGILAVGFEKIFLMQTDMNLKASEVISTYVYKVSLSAAMPDYAYGTAIGLFNALVNFALLVMVNAFSRKVSETSLW